VPGASGAINDGARGNVSAITDTDADTGATAADAGARSIDFTLEEKTGLFQVAKSKTWACTYFDRG